MILSGMDRFQLKFMVVVLTIVTLLTVTGAYAQNTGFDKAPPAVINALTADQSQDVIVLLDAAAVISQAEIIQKNEGLSPNSDEVINFKATEYGYLKDDILSSLPPGEIVILEDYSQLPMMFLKIRSLNGFSQLVGHPGVVRVYENEKYSHFLLQSLPLINQPAVAAAGKVGTGTTVAVLDTGCDYTRSAFGSCTAPGTPASCKVIYAQDFPPNDGSLDTGDFHGTNVSGIVLGVAPDTRIAALDVFSSDGYAYSNYIIPAINWCITNKATYNIVAMNMSLGGGAYSSPCSGDVFASPIANARSAGILSAIASGNNGYANMISSPGCVPAAVSVGAVYDSNLGPMNWGICDDSTTKADKVTCFSNSASFLTILAPGSVITAAGISMSGTSQATPHIAGSIAVLKGAGAFPSDTPNQTVQRMTSTGVAVTDTKNNLTKPRIDLLAATAGSGGTTYAISGTVTSGGSPLSGVTMILSGGASATTITNASGNYSFSGLSNGSYTVTPSRAGYTFTPPNRATSVSGADVTGIDFTATLIPVAYSISGNVRTQSFNSPGTPISGVTMTLSGAANATATTDTLGNYTFSGLSNSAYTITPNKNGYTFSPVSRMLNINGGNRTAQNFTGTYIGGATYTISGTVTSAGSALAGVTMTLSGGASATAITNASGNYSFSGLSNGNYTVTPSLSGYIFTPPSRTTSVSGANVSGINFTATSGVTYSISGTVTSGVNPLSGVTITLSGSASATTITNASGNYSFSGLSNGSYTVTPSLSGYVFTPPSRTTSVSSANVTGIDFTATTGVTYSISGTVSKSANAFGPGAPISGVTMTLSGAAGATTTTDASGNYIFTGLSNGSYRVTPSKTGYTFSPAYRNVLISGSSKTGQHFTGM